MFDLQLFLRLVSSVRRDWLPHRELQCHVRKSNAAVRPHEVVEAYGPKQMVEPVRRDDCTRTGRPWMKVAKVSDQIIGE